jgi:hypothetical protein
MDLLRIDKAVPLGRRHLIIDESSPDRRSAYEVSAVDMSSRYGTEARQKSTPLTV